MVGAQGWRVGDGVGVLLVLDDFGVRDLRVLEDFGVFDFLVLDDFGVLDFLVLLDFGVLEAFVVVVVSVVVVVVVVVVGWEGKHAPGMRVEKRIFVASWFPHWQASSRPKGKLSSMLHCLVCEWMKE